MWQRILRPFCTDSFNVYYFIIIKVARLSVKSSMKTQSIKLNYKSHNRDKANATELSKTLWKYKDKGIKPRITWSIVCKLFAYTSGVKRCNLCLAEKLAILQADQRTLLNKRSEFVSKCRHRNKFKLKKA